MRKKVPLNPSKCRTSEANILLRQPAERIVCLIESALSGIYMLGAEARVVGISANVYQEETFRYYAAMDERIRSRSLPTPGNWDFINIEKVVGLKPDLVIIWAHQEEAIRALEERGIPVFGIFIRSFEDVYQEMLALGDLTGKRERAVELVARTKEALGRGASRTAAVAPGETGAGLLHVGSGGSGDLRQTEHRR